ncbi:hypothetical protein [Nocardia xishanensis]
MFEVTMKAVGASDGERVGFPRGGESLVGKLYPAAFAVFDPRYRGEGDEPRKLEDPVAKIALPSTSAVRPTGV